jgi:addiction module antidote protein, HigA family
MSNLGNPYIPIHPGEILKDELQYRGISQKKFAEILDVSYPFLNEILNGKRPITTSFAVLVEAALDIKAYMLVNIQTDYDLQVTRKDTKTALRLEKIRNICASLF